MPAPKVSKEDFVRIWEESKTRAEAAKKMGLKPESCSNRARFYRKKGIPLKHYPGHNQREPSPLAIPNKKKKEAS